MKNKSKLFYILTASILSTGCSSKKCIGDDSHQGLYNALTCDYAQSIQVLKLTLDTKTIKRNKLFHNYQRLIAKATNKQKEINQLDKEIIAIDQSINDIKSLFMKSKNSKLSALTILKLKSKLKTLNMNILNKSTFFDIDDALFTQKKLLLQSDTQVYAEAYNNNLLEEKSYAKAYNQDLLKNKKYAQAYNKDLLKNKKYAQAYNKNPNETFSIAYNKDVAQDKKIRRDLSIQIENINSSLTTDTFTNSEETINNLIENIKRYSNSLKKS